MRGQLGRCEIIIDNTATREESGLVLIFLASNSDVSRTLDRSTWGIQNDYALRKTARASVFSSSPRLPYCFQRFCY